MVAVRQLPPKQTASTTDNRQVDSKTDEDQYPEFSDEDWGGIALDVDEEDSESEPQADAKVITQRATSAKLAKGGQSKKATAKEKQVPLQNRVQDCYKEASTNSFKRKVSEFLIDEPT